MAARKNLLHLSDSVSNYMVDAIGQAQKKEDESPATVEAPAAAPAHVAKVTKSRINMQFAPDVHMYIRIMSRLKGKSITDFVNGILRADMEKNREAYEAALRVVEKCN